MTFSSVLFLHVFFAALLCCYFAPFVHKRDTKNAILLLFSLAFYACGGLAYFPLILLSIAINYLFGRLVDGCGEVKKKKCLLTVAVALNLLLLFCFKYLGFLTENLNLLIPTLPVLEIVLPIGISFYTFQGLSYVVDVYRGEAKGEKSLVRVALYIALFPQLVAGPIVRYTTIADEIAAREESWDEAYAGAVRFLLGFAKKILLANPLGQMADSAFSQSGDLLTTGLAWLGALAYTGQIYFDFSGYSDMAIGLGRMFGFHFLENFNYPYISKSVTEFWRRWHISLSTWFRDYVYIPLGGNRKGKFRKAVNLMITFLVSGLWHGVHYIVWGAINGIFVLIGEKCKTPSKLLNRIGTFFTISLLWAFFVWTDTALAIRMIVSVFTTCNYAQLAASLPGIALSLADWILLFLSVLAVRFYDLHTKKITDRFHACAPAGRLAVLLAMGLFILVFGMYGIGFEAEAFIYSKF